VSGHRFTYDECEKTLVRGTMDAGINNVIYMELYSGPKMANVRCGKTIDTGTIDRGSTVLCQVLWCLFCITDVQQMKSQNIRICVLHVCARVTI